MSEQFRISIITPIYNSVKFLDQSINSVLCQTKSFFQEHIFLDNMSNDGSEEVLKRYHHLTWIREPDLGQSNAMNKGVSLAKGNIIGFLNADDYYLPDVLDTVVSAFKDGAKVVAGQVIMEFEDGSTWLNDPATTLNQMLCHWKDNSFPNNPVGYFFHRSVLEKTGPFNEENHLTMDLEYLLDVIAHFPITKINKPFGIYRYHPESKTAKTMNQAMYWSEETFPYLERSLTKISARERSRFHTMQIQAYQEKNSHNQQIQHFLQSGEKGTLQQNEIFDVIRKNLQHVAGDKHPDIKPDQFGALVIENHVDLKVLNLHLENLRRNLDVQQCVIVVSQNELDPQTVQQFPGVLFFTTTMNIKMLRRHLIKYMAFRYFHNSYAYAGPIAKNWIYMDTELLSPIDLYHFLNEWQIREITAYSNQNNKNIPQIVVTGKYPDSNAFATFGFLAEKAMEQPTASELLKRLRAISLSTHDNLIQEEAVDLLNKQIHKLSQELINIRNSYSWKIGQIIIKPIQLFRHLMANKEK